MEATAPSKTTGVQNKSTMGRFASFHDQTWLRISTGNQHNSLSGDIQPDLDVSGFSYMGANASGYRRPLYGFVPKTYLANKLIMPYNGFPFKQSKVFCFLFSALYAKGDSAQRQESSCFEQYFVLFPAMEKAGLLQLSINIKQMESVSRESKSLPFIAGLHKWASAYFPEHYYICDGFWALPLYLILFWKET